MPDVHHGCTMSTEARKVHQIPWNWSYSCHMGNAYCIGVLWKSNKCSYNWDISADTLVFPFKVKNNATVVSGLKTFFSFLFLPILFFFFFLPGKSWPDDWLQKQGKCYKFYMNFKSWTDSKISSAVNKSQLVVIQDKAELVRVNLMELCPW